MKPEDLYILYHALVCKGQNTPLHSSAALQKNCTEATVKAAQRRLEHVGLLHAKTQTPNLERVRLFLLEAISFWWPAAKTKAGQGLPLVLSSSRQILAVGKTTPPMEFVWPCDGEFAEGDVISPLWADLPQLVTHDRGLHEFFSWVEILRFKEHIMKSWAQKEMKQFLDSIQKLGSQHFPSPDQDFLELQEEEFETLVRFICQNGFRALTLQKAALITGLSSYYLMEKFETDQALRLWIAGKFHEKAFEFLGPLLGQLHNMNKGHLALVLEEFLNYVESHEDYYKMSLWIYLENDPALQELNRRGLRSFFASVLTLFKKSKPEALEQAEFYAYLFTSIWRLYAAFIWTDSKPLVPSIHLPKLKSEIKGFIMRSVFENY